jgi:hypothetical protein
MGAVKGGLLPVPGDFTQRLARFQSRSRPSRTDNHYWFILWAAGYGHTERPDCRRLGFTPDPRYECARDIWKPKYGARSTL